MSPRWTWGAALLLSACTLVSSYPAPAAEVCIGDVDEDLDGLVDCRDPDCDGRCTEHDLASCANRRDDDGDGLADHADPGCWPLAALTLTPRCPLIAGATLDVAPTLSEWAVFASAAPPHETTDPYDSTRHVLGVDPATYASITPTHALDGLTGAWVGTHLSVRLVVTGTNAQQSDVLFDFGAFQVGLGDYRGQTGLQLARGDQWVTQDTSPTLDGWWIVEVDVSGGPTDDTVEVDAVATSGAGRMLHVAHEVSPVGLTGNVRLSAFLMAAAGEGRALVDTLSVERPEGRTCRVEIPVSRALVSAEQPLVWTAALEGDDRVCVLSAAGAVAGTVALWRGGADETASVPADVAGTPAVARDPGHGVLRGVAPAGDGSLIALEGDDCSAWRPLGTVVDAGDLLPSPPTTDWPTFALSYSVGADGDEIAVPVAEDGTRGVQLFASASDAPTVFAPLRFVSLESLLVGVPSEPTPFVQRTWQTGISVARVGPDHVYLVARPERVAIGEPEDLTLRAYVEAPDGTLVAIPGVVQHVVAGTQHDRGVSRGVLVARGPTRYDLVLPSQISTLEVGPGALCDVPGSEVCNALDDDCDGLVDDGLACAP